MNSKNNIPFLNPGEQIRIIAPASVVERDYIVNTVQSLEALGYKVSLGKYIFSVFNQFAGTDEQRIQDFQEGIDDSEVKAIFCARGGYGSVRIINSLDFSSFREHPKWIVGFSDITIFHTLLNNQFSLPSIHAPMPVNFSSTSFQNNLRQLNNILIGKLENISIEKHALNIEGIGKGNIVGGNLSILYSLQATSYEIDTENKILFIEDVGEQLYHLDRMLQNFSLSGKFKDITGLIVGGLTAMKDKKRPFGKNAEEIIREYVEDSGIPVAFGFPAGHIENNVPFMLGAKIELEVEECKVILRCM